MKKIQDYDPKEYIIVKGAKLNNLKNIDIVIPRNKLDQLKFYHYAHQ